GFTLVELIVVIVIIAILAGVLIPTFGMVIERARVSNDTTNVKNMNQYLALAALDYKVSHFTADEVKNILIEFDLKAEQKGKSLWYDRANNKMVIDDDTTTLNPVGAKVNDSHFNALNNISSAYAEPAQPKAKILNFSPALEAVGNNTAWLYMDSNNNKPVGKAINTIKNLIEETKKANKNSVGRSTLLATFNTAIATLNPNVKEVLQNFSPATTLYIASDGFYSSIENPKTDISLVQVLNFTNVVFIDGLKTLPVSDFKTYQPDIKIRVVNPIIIPCTISSLSVTAEKPGTFVNLTNDTVVSATVPSVITSNTINPNIVVAQPSVNNSFRIQVMLMYPVSESKPNDPRKIVACPLDGTIIFVPVGSSFYIDITTQERGAMATFNVDYISFGKSADGTIRNASAIRITYFNADGTILAYGEVNYIETDAVFPLTNKMVK
ncbi:MAG: prepilin-type N-terminal cleavage/methylation domain-containing protein, partial [Clostridia bacterium]